MDREARPVEIYVHDCGHRYKRTLSEKPVRKRLTAICIACFDPMPVVDEGGHLYRYVSVDSESLQEAIYRT